MAEIGVLKGLLRKRNRPLAAYVFAGQTTEIVLNVLKARLTRQKPIYYRKNGFKRYYHRLSFSVTYNRRRQV
ncbi:MAG: hypothetical protein PUJ49_05870, partial [bacterium]|nr:hypothetical protein [bacterium]